MTETASLLGCRRWRIGARLIFADGVAWQGDFFGGEVEAAAVATTVAAATAAWCALRHDGSVEDWEVLWSLVGIGRAGNSVDFWGDLLHGEGSGCVEVAEGIVDGLAAVEEEVHASW